MALADGHLLLLALAANWLKQTGNLELDTTALGFFERLFANYHGKPEAQVDEIFGELFGTLPERLQSLLLGVSVYRDAFGVDGAQAMVVDAAEDDLGQLTEQAFLLRQGDLWTLHPLVQQAVRQTLGQRGETGAVHRRTIEFFEGQVSGEISSLEDCYPLLESFHHYCELGEYLAAKLTLNRCYDFLNLRGHYQTIVQVYGRLTQAWKEPADEEEQRNLGWAWTSLGNAYYSLGQYKQAIKCYTQHLEIAYGIGDRSGQGGSSGGLGLAYDSLGEYEQAIDYHKQWLEIKRGIGNRLGEGNSLFNLALALVSQSASNRDQALGLWQQARDIYEAIGVEYWAKRCDEEMQKLQRRQRRQKRLRWVLGIVGGLLLAVALHWSLTR